MVRFLRFCLPLLGLLLAAQPALNFCGFYVAKGGAELFNNSSEVILARRGDSTRITMASDYSGDVQDFAMVVPVPKVLRRKQIRIIKSPIFKRLDDYSAPRLVEYQDENPCQPPVVAYSMEKSSNGQADASGRMNDGVAVAAEYNIGEYNIKILSASNSRGLERWLRRHDYELPAKAQAVLEPYIQNDMKFFVVKVNLAQYKAGETKQLRPLQIAYSHERYMLPIRLGMANGKGFQDMIVYAFSEVGRVEPVNYPLREIPTNVNIPTSVEGQFGEFYAAVFEQAWRRADRNKLMLEYFWDLSANNFTKCDPCPTQPPTFAELRDAGVFWVDKKDENNDRRRRARGGANYEGELYITRLHVRYNRQLYPQDLIFQETPNKQNFQGRYIMRHKADGPLDCERGQRYLRKREEREEQARHNLAYLTGWAVQEDGSINKNAEPEKGQEDRGFAWPTFDSGGRGPGGGSTFWRWQEPRLWLTLGVLLAMTALFGWQQRRRALARQREPRGA